MNCKENKNILGFTTAENTAPSEFIFTEGDYTRIAEKRWSRVRESNDFPESFKKEWIEGCIAEMKQMDCIGEELAATPLVEKLNYLKKKGFSI
jgi:hypothetical protein